MIALLSALALATTTVAAPVMPFADPHGQPISESPHRRLLPGFAAALAQLPVPAGPAAWTVIPDAAAWAQLATAAPDGRQPARWRYARSLIGGGRGTEALGVLDVMRQDDSDLGLTDAWQLAHGIALAQSGHYEDARGALDAPGLAGNSEACAWRLRALAGQARAAVAIDQMPCALPALNARPVPVRRPFLLAAAGAAVAAGNPVAALGWLAVLPDNDGAANLLRARAEIARGNAAAGALRFKRVAGFGTAAQQIDANVALAELGAGPDGAAAPATLPMLDHVALTWRGDAIEQRVLQLSYRTGIATHDSHRALVSGAALFRYFQLGPDLVPLVTQLQALLAAGLAPGNALPIEQAAGLYWDYRDLAPVGAEGDFLVNQLADRLGERGLYGRAGELLHHQLIERTRDIAQGPLSVKVATLDILAGYPDRAVAAIRETDAPAYPDTMIWDRHRVEAIALVKLGRVNEALAALQDVPDAALVRAEIFWKRRDWAALEHETPPPPPAAGRLGTPEQALVLRHAIALAMQGHEDALVRLRMRYSAAFVGLPTAPMFDLLTRSVDTVDANALAQAMLAIPTVVPVDRIADMLDAPAAPKQVL
jgi:hypothetical protein